MGYAIRFSDEALRQLAVPTRDVEERIRRAVPNLDEEHLASNLTPLGLNRFALDLAWDRQSLTMLLQPEYGEDVLLVTGVFPRLSPRVPLTRTQAIEVVRAGIGKRPDLPSGSEYVEQVKKTWRGLLPND